MVEVDELGWLRCVEGLRRGVVGPFVQANTISGNDCCRTYLDGETPVGCMIVYCGNTSTPSHECARRFGLAQSVIDATRFICIPTQEELEIWNDEENETGVDVTVLRIAEREAEL